MFIYIRIRFKKWQYGLVLWSLSYTTRLWYFHSSPYSMVSCRFLWKLTGFHRGDSDGNGYSMTDTVVVFDRIREFGCSCHHAADQKKVINDALNATLSRTINTSYNLLRTLAIFIFGGEVIRGFGIRSVDWYRDRYLFIYLYRYTNCGWFRVRKNKAW